jgi:hypothetical protein
MGVEEIVHRPGDGHAGIVLAVLAHAHDSERAVCPAHRHDPGEMGEFSAGIHLHVAGQHWLPGGQILGFLDAGAIVEIPGVGRRLGDNQNRSGLCGRLCRRMGFFGNGLFIDHLRGVLARVCRARAAQAERQQQRARGNKKFGLARRHGELFSDSDAC